ncbi:DsrE family protein [Thalassolituus hydrocarboniclasticus]|uniref:DsrE family protein n=1 Tax=Thalassolituus hydrocarboniclasticus TaxID=2742796 RepID=A0ABY6A974_9GAMM|nr:DsrE family protein [Thalassolituus hydrocarboniclasticus]UXD87526.1 DsrE family protein [Thalassolituus hydrocarboniclasticus]
MSTVSIVIRSAPANDPEALEMALALAAFEHEIRLIFQGPGIFWLMKTQEARKPGGKSPAKVISALPMYDCEAIFYAQSDLQQLNIPAENLTPLAKPLSYSDITELLRSSQHCLSF